jgi:hypothetical protein
MKIHQLPMGARFEYQGQEYVKTGPMVGSYGDGQRFFAKHAELKAIGVIDLPASVLSETLPRAAVVAAFEAFCAECEGLVTDKAALAAARAKFLQALEG